MRFPCGFMDVITIDKTDENFRLLHDTKGRFVMHRITVRTPTTCSSKQLDVVGMEGVVGVQSKLAGG